MPSTVKEQPVTKRERRRAELEARRNRRERERTDRDKSLLVNGALALAFFGVLLVVALTLDPDDAAYGKSHGALLLACASAGLLLVIMRESVGEITRSLRRALSLDPTLDAHGIALALFGVVFAIATVTVLFVVDYGSLGTGFRVGGVIAVGLAKLSRTALTSFQE